MCGIGAVCGSRIGDGEAVVRKSLGAVTHRGYSLYEISAFEGCALGANRLEIIDAPNSRQPLANEDGSVFAVFNGEIFNHEQLRSELQEKGHRFKSRSDTEVLVHLWEEHGPQMVKKLDSEMFALFIYDRKRRSFFAARDPYGVKPLYHASDDSGNLHFASEMKQLTQFGEIGEVREFPPGHMMIDGRLSRYHDIPRPGPEAAEPVPQIIANLRRLFDSAVEKRVRTELPLGVFFSGGLDSGAVLATARKFHTDITALAVGRPDSPDILSARRYCDESGIRLLSLNTPPEEEMVKLVPRIVLAAESFEPQLVRYAAISHFMSALARKNGFRVVLCGEGSDELFAGYRFYESCRTEAELSGRLIRSIEVMPRIQFQRVDRTSMMHTVEARLPFFDTSFADYSIRIPAGLKLRSEGSRKISKWIFREAMKDRLPGYIVEREKAIMSDGAGYKRAEGKPGLFSAIAAAGISDSEFAGIRKDYPGWNITDKETAYYFRIYAECGFTKARFSRKRPLRQFSLQDKARALLSRINPLFSS